MIAHVLQALGVVFVVQLVVTFAILTGVSVRDRRKRRPARRVVAEFMDAQDARLKELREQLGGGSR